MRVRRRTPKTMQRPTPSQESPHAARRDFEQTKRFEVLVRIPSVRIRCGSEGTVEPLHKVVPNHFPCMHPHPIAMCVVVLTFATSALRWRVFGQRVELCEPSAWPPKGDFVGGTLRFPMVCR